MNRPTNPLLSTIVGLIVAMTWQGALARPLDAVGPCEGGGALTTAAPPYQGNARSMLNNIGFARAHLKSTSREIPAIKDLSWNSGPNRTYQGDGQVVVVATVCSPVDCDDRDYFAFEPSTGLYGGAIYEGGHVREFGATPTEPTYDFRLGAALTCARNLDWSSKALPLPR